MDGIGKYATKNMNVCLMWNHDVFNFNIKLPSQ